MQIQALIRRPRLLNLAALSFPNTGRVVRFGVAITKMNPKPLLPCRYGIWQRVALAYDMLYIFRLRGQGAVTKERRTMGVPRGFDTDAVGDLRVVSDRVIECAFALRADLGKRKAGETAMRISLG